MEDAPAQDYHLITDCGQPSSRAIQDYSFRPCRCFDDVRDEVGAVVDIERVHLFSGHEVCVCRDSRSSKHVVEFRGYS